MDSKTIEVKTLYQDINDNPIFKSFAEKFTELLNLIYQIIELPVQNLHLEGLFLAHIHLQYGNRMEILDICNTLKQFIINFIFIITINHEITDNTKRLFPNRKVLINLALNVMEQSKMFVEHMRLKSAKNIPPS